MKHTTTQQQARAEAIFRRKEEQRLDAPKAMAEYNAKTVAMRERTARLRALRLAQEAAENIEEKLHHDAERAHARH